MAQSRTSHRTGPGLALLNPSQMDHISMSDEDVAVDMDEPPESSLQFARKSVNATPVPPDHTSPKQPGATRMCRSPSLLTQGLLISPDLHPVPIDTAMARAHSTASSGSMASSTAELTSDGGLTSPARTSTPSPPFPYTMHTGLALIPSKSLDGFQEDEAPHPAALPSHPQPISPDAATPVAPVPRKRCITFACTQPKKEAPKEAPKEPAPEVKKPEETTRKTCLKFACPMKPSRTPEEPAKTQSTRLRIASPAPSKMVDRLHRESQSTIKEPSEDHVETPKPEKKSKPEVLRTHEFAAPKNEEETWIKEGPSSRHKITVSDTLRKENAIRQLAEEAEEEALEEEEQDEEDELEDELDELDSDEDEDEDDDGYDSEDESDGNETDDEEGFADSDDESDDGSEYQFWTPGVTTAATSVEQLEHIRSRQYRSASESSIEASINTNGVPISPPAQPAKKSKDKRSRQQAPMRPRTPELPDSTDFVCGTFDEDRPLEAAYLSCMEQRRIAKKGVLPQDVDPSFPTSDPEDDDDEIEEEGEVDDEEDHSWVAGRLDDVEETPVRGRARSNSHRQPRKSPIPSPQLRLRSPPPPKRGKSPAPTAMKRQNSHRAPSPAPAAMKRHNSHRGPSPAPVAMKRHNSHRAPSPAPAAMKRQNSHRAPSPAPAAMKRQNSRRTQEQPRRLFNRSPAPRVPPSTRHLPSPPASREGSISGDARPSRLAQRPNLTRTKSLPRTPNPFFHQGQRRARQAAAARGVMSAEASEDEDDGDNSDTVGTAGEEPPLHSRGPIDIVQGLEQKRQRRKEKFWRQHGRNAARDREREARRQRAAPGKGAERMRDIGLEMADRTKGYGQQRVPLVLSV